MQLQIDQKFTLTVSCHDRVGIVAGVTGHLADNDAFILESQQFADLDAERFFLRMEFASAGSRFPASLKQLRAGFTEVGDRLSLEWELVDSAARPRMIVAVSRAGHCLNDLLYRWRTGMLPVEIVGVVSNHDDLRALTEWHGLPYHYLPIEADKREQQEQALLRIVEEGAADYLALARYMQILSPTLTARLAGFCINIHHSFLPSFKGARPYQRAHERGVKLIGATAHFVTSELDEGPIIEQDVERVDHRADEADLVRIGKDIEARVLATAVRWLGERRVFLNGNRTIVFR